MRWDEKNIYYYVNEGGELVLRVNTKYTYNNDVPMIRHLDKTQQDILDNGTEFNISKNKIYMEKCLAERCNL